jgi:hypothetical protein
MRCDADAAAKADADGKAAADAKAKADADKDSGQARVKGALDKAEAAEKRAAEAEAALQVRLKADKDAEEAKALKKGEHEKIIEQRTKELAEATAANETAKGQLEAYEKVLKGQLDTALKAIADEPKRKTVEKLLEGKSLADQVALLPDVLAAIGAQAPATFGGPTPTSGSGPSAVEMDQKQKRYSELLTKRDITPTEKAERNTLMKELEKSWQEKHKAS